MVIEIQQRTYSSDKDDYHSTCDHEGSDIDPVDKMMTDDNGVTSDVAMDNEANNEDNGTVLLAIALNDITSKLKEKKVNSYGEVSRLYVDTKEIYSYVEKAPGKYKNGNLPNM
jgi:hypothetical protein